MDKSILTASNQTQMIELGRQLVREIKPGVNLIIMQSDLGGGKTTLTKGIVDQLGGEIDEVSSPTFTLHDEYDLPPEGLFTKVNHFDLYRLSDPGIMLDDIYESVAFSDQLTIIEWPQILADDLNSFSYLLVEIDYLPTAGRQLFAVLSPNLAFALATTALLNA